MWIKLIVLIGLIKTCEFSIVFRDNEDENEDGPSENFYTNQVANHVANLGLNSVLSLPSLDSNVILSPLNIYSCLGILELGAAGETKDEVM